jgi:hypothetical protein
MPFDILYINFFNEISEKLNIPVKFNNFGYHDERLLDEYNKLPDKYKNLDILIINSIPRGDQYKVDINMWNNYITNLEHEGFKLVTTHKVHNLVCTLDDNLSLFQIGAISTHAKIIIAINTGPITAIFNDYTLNNAKKIYIIDNRVEYINILRLVNINDLNDININELKQLIAT